MSNERRRATRQRSLLRGLAYLGNSPSAMNCVVRDISETGARLQFSGPVTAPDMIDLHIPAKNQTLHCRVSWREVDEIGVRFATEKATAEPASDEELSQRVERLETEIAQLKHLIKKLQRTAGAITDAA
jgi:hypothetical protein